MTQDSGSWARASIIYTQESIALEPKGQPYGEIAEEDFKPIVDLRRLALQEAVAFDPSGLSRLHADMPAHFENEYLRGLGQWIEGYDNDDFTLMNRGTFLINDWGNWYSKVREDILDR